MTSSLLEPATFRLVAFYLNHYAILLLSAKYTEEILTGEHSYMLFPRQLIINNQIKKFSFRYIGDKCLIIITMGNDVIMFRKSKSQILSFNKIQGKQIGIKPSIYIFKV
jgi:hypothetical protein